MKKTVYKIAIILVFCLIFAAVAFAAGENYKKELVANYVGVRLVVHGTAVTPKDVNGNNVDPFIVDGTTYLPVRAVAEALGEEVFWDGATKTVYIGERPESTPEPTPVPSPEVQGTESITVGATYIVMNTVYGVEPRIIWRNNSGKTIKYITFTVTPFNAVGDVVSSTIGNKATCDIQVTGPIDTFDKSVLYSFPKDGLAHLYFCKCIPCNEEHDNHFGIFGYDSLCMDKKKEQFYFYVGTEKHYIDNSVYEYVCDQLDAWDPIWYNSTIVRFTIDKISVEYMDGSKEIIKYPSILSAGGIYYD